MKFTIKRPCEHCPFRSDVHPFLRRAPQIAKQMKDDHYWFACHETTGVSKGKRVRRSDQSHCMGLAAVLWSMGMPNIAMRLALSFKMITVAQLEAPKNTFRSLTEFVQHHARG